MAFLGLGVWPKFGSFNKSIVLFLLLHSLAINGGITTLPPGTTTTANNLARNGENSRHEVLDDKNKYILIWDSDFDAQIITFQLIVETSGFVGFGISPNGGMTGADIVIGGVHPNGTSYFSDYFGTGNENPQVDPKQDWKILEAAENGTHTTLKFSRLFNTCDKNDFKIGNDTSYLIWSFGETDRITYHANRGSFSVNLLDPPMPDFVASPLSVWRISSDYEMPADATTYWCTVHTGPALTSKHHAIGFEPYLPTAAAKTHTHHCIMHECRGDNKTDLKELIKPVMNSNGDHCYHTGNASKLLQHCQSYLLAWASGGKKTSFPEKVGIPLGDAPSANYYVMEIHYNNPEQLQGVKFEAGLNVFYTSKLREFDAALLAVGHDVISTQVIPPRTKSFITVGHCSSECTSEVIPPNGINIFNVELHSHLAGRKIKVRQFRAGKEIPWMSNDDNYNFDFQQNRPMRDEVKLLPGDQLAVECVYDTTSRENVTIGGFASQDEMCLAFILYYPKMDMWFCGSRNPLETYNHFGLEDGEGIPGTTDILITAPKQNSGKRYTTLLNEINWTADKVKDLQTNARFGNHTVSCRYNDNRKTAESEVTYPNFAEEYVVRDSCQIKPNP